jgi:acyl-CoA synthetase (AMP-forming)/AMP-acid ligase II
VSSRDRLVLDGIPVPDGMFRAMVGDLAKGLDEIRVEAGHGVEITARQPLAVLAAVAACRMLGLPLVFGARFPAACPSVILPVGARIHDGGVNGGERAAPVIAPVSTRTDLKLPEDVSTVFWTSGTTGEPKAVPMTWQALDYQAEATRERLGLDERDTLLTSLPPDHSYGHSLVQLWLRYRPGLIIESAFHLERVISRLRRLPVTSVDGVPGLFAALLRKARTDTETRTLLAGLRLRGCGGDLLPRHLAQHFLDVVGAPLHDGYGLTEAGPNVAIAGPDSTRLGAVAPPLPGTRLAIEPESGEILVRSASVMPGYLGDPPGTRAVFTADGWLCTGDLGRLDPDGYLVVLGRSKDVLMLQGETYSPMIVEDVFRGCPGVAEASAIGLPVGEARGDRIVVFLTGDGSERPSPEILRDHCSRELPPGLRPQAFRWIDEMPLLASGKVDKRVLRPRAMDLLAKKDGVAP